MEGLRGAQDSGGLARGAQAPGKLGEGFARVRAGGQHLVDSLLGCFRRRLARQAERGGDPLAHAIGIGPGDQMQPPGPADQPGRGRHQRALAESDRPPLRARRAEPQKGSPAGRQGRQQQAQRRGQIGRGEGQGQQVGRAAKTVEREIEGDAAAVLGECGVDQHCRQCGVFAAGHSKSSRSGSNTMITG